jgi:hypothetical protein
MDLTNLVYAITDQLRRCDHADACCAENADQNIFSSAGNDFERGLRCQCGRDAYDGRGVSR